MLTRNETNTHKQITAYAHKVVKSVASIYDNLPPPVKQLPHTRVVHHIANIFRSAEPKFKQARPHLLVSIIAAIVLVLGRATPVERDQLVREVLQEERVLIDMHRLHHTTSGDASSTLVVEPEDVVSEDELHKNVGAMSLHLSDKIADSYKCGLTTTCSPEQYHHHIVQNYNQIFREWMPTGSKRTTKDLKLVFLGTLAKETLKSNDMFLSMLKKGQPVTDIVKAEIKAICDGPSCTNIEINTIGSAVIKSINEDSTAWSTSGRTKTEKDLLGMYKDIAWDTIQRALREQTTDRTLREQATDRALREQTTDRTLREQATDIQKIIRENTLLYLLASGENVQESINIGGEKAKIQADWSATPAIVDTSGKLISRWLSTFDNTEIDRFKTTLRTDDNSDWSDLVRTMTQDARELRKFIDSNSQKTLDDLSKGENVSIGERFKQQFESTMGMLNALGLMTMTGTTGIVFLVATFFALRYIGHPIRLCCTTKRKEEASAKHAPPKRKAARREKTPPRATNSDKVTSKELWRWTDVKEDSKLFHYLYIKDGNVMRRVKYSKSKDVYIELTTGGVHQVHLNTDMEVIGDFDKDGTLTLRDGKYLRRKKKEKKKKK